MRNRRLFGLLAAIALAGAAPLLTACPKPKPKKEKKVVKPKGPDAQQLLAEARAAVTAGDIDGADAKYQQAYKLAPDYAIVAEHVDVLINASRVDAAVTTAQAYYDAQATDPRGSHLYAHALIAAGSFETALGVAEELIGLDDNDAAAHEKRGRALVFLGRVPEGIEELQKAVSIDPKNPTFLIELGSALHKGNRVGEAALQLRAAIQLDPENGRAHLLLGLALKDMAEIEEAVVYFTKAAKLLPDGRPWFELGIMQNKRGDDLGAEESLAEAVKRSGDNGLYWYAYGEMLRFNKKFDEAVEAYAQSMQQKEPHPKAAAKRGLALAEAGRIDEAEVFLTEAIRNDPENPYVHFNLAVVYNRRKNWKASISEFEAFLKYADAADGDRGKANDCIKNAKKKKPCS
jgi:tetratricopeptide (TPR) repeat protein